MIQQEPFQLTGWVEGAVDHRAEHPPTKRMGYTVEVKDTLVPTSSAVNDYGKGSETKWQASKQVC